MGSNQAAQKRKGEIMNITKQANGKNNRFFFDDVSVGGGMELSNVWIDIDQSGKCLDSSLKIGSKTWQKAMCILSRAGHI
jgi:hypothetical protein